MTWLDTVSPRDVHDSLTYVATLPDQADYLDRAADDPRFALWLRLADQHAAAAARETLRPAAIPQESFPWRGAFALGWSPRGAAEAAHDGPQPAVIAALRGYAERGVPRPPGIHPDRGKAPEQEREL